MSRISAARTMAALLETLANGLTATGYAHHVRVHKLAAPLARLISCGYITQVSQGAMDDLRSTIMNLRNILRIEALKLKAGDTISWNDHRADGGRATGEIVSFSAECPDVAQALSSTGNLPLINIFNCTMDVERADAPATPKTIEIGGMVTWTVRGGERAAGWVQDISGTTIFIGNEKGVTVGAVDLGDELAAIRAMPSPM